MLFQNRPHESTWKPTALVIDRDADVHRSIHVMLGKDYDVHHAYFPRLALSLLQKRTFNVVFTSFDMTASDELPELHQTIETIAKSRGIPVIGLGDEASTSEAFAGWISKASVATCFEAALRMALSKETKPEE